MTPLADAARETLSEIICRATCEDNECNHYSCCQAHPLSIKAYKNRKRATAILSTFPILTAPTQDAVEAARALYKQLGRDAILRQHDPVQTIAAAITAREARVREECAKWHDEQAATEQGRADKHKENGNWDLRVTYERLANIHRNSAAAIRAGGGA